MIVTKTPNCHSITRSMWQST